MSMITPSRLTDDELTAAVAALAAREREATVLLVVHLAELDARGLYLGAGFGSLYQYCREVLRLSEQAAYNRIAAARAVRRFPAIVGMLERGDVNLTTVKVLAPHLTDANHEGLLGASVRKSRLAVEALVADRFPRASAEAGRKAPVIVPLGGDRYEVRFNAGGPTLEKLKTAQDLLRHTVPEGDGGAILDRALTSVITETARRKFSATVRPGAARPVGTQSRDIPAAVEREVWQRDGGQCAFVARNGRRCAARDFVEFHHVRPWVAGGPPTAENIALRCRSHNQYEASVYFAPIKAAMAAAHTTRPGTSGDEARLDG
jgi:HNH endonuclease